MHAEFQAHALSQQLATTLWQFTNVQTGFCGQCVSVLFHLATSTTACSISHLSKHSLDIDYDINLITSSHPHSFGFENDQMTVSVGSEVSIWAGDRL